MFLVVVAMTFVVEGRDLRALYISDSPCAQYPTFRTLMGQRLRCPDHWNCTFDIDCHTTCGYTNLSQMIYAGPVARPVGWEYCTKQQQKTGFNGLYTECVYGGWFSYDLILADYCKSASPPDVIFLQLGLGDGLGNPWLNRSRFALVIFEFLARAGCSASITLVSPHPLMSPPRSLWNNQSTSLNQERVIIADSSLAVASKLSNTGLLATSDVSYMNFSGPDIYDALDYNFVGDPLHFCLGAPARCPTAERLSDAVAKAITSKLRVRAKSLTAPETDIWGQVRVSDNFAGVPLSLENGNGAGLAGLPQVSRQTYLNRRGNGTSGNGTSTVCDLGISWKFASCLNLGKLVLVHLLLFVGINILICCIAMQIQKQQVSPRSLSRLAKDHAARPQRLSGLDGSRIIGALGIVGFHVFHGSCSIDRSICIIVHGSRLWVQWFFLLSGFVSVWSDMTQGPSLDICGFGDMLKAMTYARVKLCRRIWTLYPLYVVAFAIDINAWHHLVLGGLNGWYALLLHVLMIQAWLPPFASDLPNGPAWFVSCLVFFWLVAPLWSCLLRRYPCKLLFVVLIACVLFGGFHQLIVASIGLEFQRGAWYGVAVNHFLAFSPLANVHFFFAGCVVAALAGRLDLRWHSWQHALIICGMTVMAISWWAFGAVAATNSFLLIEKGFFTLPAWICLALFLVDPSSPVARWSSVTAPASNLAYAVYILHVPVSRLVGYMCNFFRWQLHPVGHLVLICAGAALIFLASRSAASLLCPRQQSTEFASSIASGGSVELSDLHRLESHAEVLPSQQKCMTN